MPDQWAIFRGLDIASAYFDIAENENEVAWRRRVELARNIALALQEAFDRGGMLSKCSCGEKR